MKRKRARWTRNTGKPYIRRANGNEKADTIKMAYRLAFHQLTAIRALRKELGL